MSLNNTNNSSAAKGLPQEDLTGLLGLPLELFEEITSRLSPVDVGELRLVHKQVDWMIWSSFLRKLIKGRTIYATFANMAHFLGMLQAFGFRSLNLEVTELCVVADGLKVPEYGYEWAWENLLQWDVEGLEPTEQDMDIITDINHKHANFVAINNTFINGGGYRSMLVSILNICPNLRVLNVRKLKPGEHLLGWVDPEDFKKLSFHYPGMNTKDIYYGDWQYDTLHLRKTHYTDEFGEAIVEPNAGPQASFIDDLNAAITACGRPITTNFIRG